jgi:hypothetical protein
LEVYNPSDPDDFIALVAPATGLTQYLQFVYEDLQVAAITVDTAGDMIVSGNSIILPALTTDWDAGPNEIRAETFESDVVTGTAPFTIASTTLVTNLNADMLDGLHASELGITVEEEDAAPSVSGVIKIQVPNSTLTDDGGGTVSLDYASSGHTHDGIKLSEDFHVPGALVVTADVGGAFISPDNRTIEAIYIYCGDAGSASTTTVDVHLNGTTIFTTQANRPQLAWDDANGVAKSGTPDTPDLVENDILTFDIDAIGTDASDLTIVVVFAELASGSGLVTIEDWIAPTLLNSWSNQGAPWAVAGYYKDPFGRVHLKGQLTGGSASANFFVLPVGYRPSEQLLFIIIANGAVAQCLVKTDGSVYHNGGATLWLSLSGISFEADASSVAWGGAASVEDWIDVDTGVGFQNSWVNYGGGLAPAAYYKDPFGRVHIRGLVKNGTAGTVMFTLPVGYRPTYRAAVATVANSAIAMIYVEPNGDMGASFGSNAWCYLDGLSFRAA